VAGSGVAAGGGAATGSGVAAGAGGPEGMGGLGAGVAGGEDAMDVVVDEGEGGGLGDGEEGVGEDLGGWKKVQQRRKKSPIKQT
jgi:hypothetical protein